MYAKRRIFVLFPHEIPFKFWFPTEQFAPPDSSIETWRCFFLFSWIIHYRVLWLCCYFLSRRTNSGSWQIFIILMGTRTSQSEWTNVYLSANVSRICKNISPIAISALRSFKMSTGAICIPSQSQHQVLRPYPQWTISFKMCSLYSFFSLVLHSKHQTLFRKI